jgi:hypothetical protein
VGAAFATAVGAGGIMIFSQLVTVGVMFLVASGSIQQYSFALTSMHILHL